MHLVRRLGIQLFMELGIKGFQCIWGIEFVIFEVLGFDGILGVGFSWHLGFRVFMAFGVLRFS